MKEGNEIKGKMKSLAKDNTESMTKTIMIDRLKNKSLATLKIMLCSMIIAVMSTGCSINKSDNTSETGNNVQSDHISESDENTQSNGTDKSAGSSDNGQDGVGNHAVKSYDGNNIIYTYQNITLTLPEAWEGRYVITENEDQKGFTVLQKASNDKQEGWGFLFSVYASDMPYVDMPGGEALAYTKDKIYYFSTPTDVPYDCEDAEVGCVGAKKFTRGSLRPQVNYIVELDRRGSNDAVFYRCDNPEFEGFVTSFGFETASGSCSDISYIAPYLETAAVNISCGYYCEHQRHEYICLEEMELNAARVAQMVTQQTEHFEYREQQDSFFGGRVYQYSMWDTASERDTYKWLSPLPKEAKIKLGTAELIMPHAKIDRQGKVHRYVPKLKAAVLTENAIAVMPDGKKARYDSQKAKSQKVMPLSRALEILNTI